MSFYVVVEGHGDRAAAPNLLSRLSDDLGFHGVVWKPPLRINVMRESDAEQAAELLRPRSDAEGVLVLRDDEDGCPRTDGPQIATWFKRLGLPFPVACVLLYREYETLFLPGLDLLAGKPLVSGGIERRGIDPHACFDGDPEGPRDAKAILTSAMPPGRAYKETTDQLAFTRMLDFGRLRQRQLPCFLTLQRALTALLTGALAPGDVFPLDR